MPAGQETIKLAERNENNRFLVSFSVFLCTQMSVISEKHCIVSEKNDRDYFIWCSQLNICTTKIDHLDTIHAKNRNSVAFSSQFPVIYQHLLRSYVYESRCAILMNSSSESMIFCVTIRNAIKFFECFMDIIHSRENNFVRKSSGFFSHIITPISKIRMKNDSRTEHAWEMRYKFNTLNFLQSTVQYKASFCFME